MLQQQTIISFITIIVNNNYHDFLNFGSTYPENKNYSYNWSAGTIRPHTQGLCGQMCQAVSNRDCECG